MLRRYSCDYACELTSNLWINLSGNIWKNEDTYFNTVFLYDIGRFVHSESKIFVHINISYDIPKENIFYTIIYYSLHYGRKNNLMGYNSM